MPLCAALVPTVVTMVDGGRLPSSGEVSRVAIDADIRHSRHFSVTHVCAPKPHDRKGVRGSDKGKAGNR